MTVTFGTASTAGIVKRIDFALVTCHSSNIGPTLALTRDIMTFIILRSQSSTVATWEVMRHLLNVKPNPSCDTRITLV